MRLTEDTKYICVGKIVNTHGLKGEVKIYPYLNPKEDFDFIESLTISHNADISREYKNTVSDDELKQKGKVVEIERIRYQKNMVLACFAGFNKIEDVEIMKNHLVFALKGEIAEEDGYFYSDIIGFDVIDNNLGKIGAIVDVNQGVAQDIIIVDLGNDKSCMIPSVKEFVKQIDNDNRKIMVELIEGMIE